MSDIAALTQVVEDAAQGKVEVADPARFNEVPVRIAGQVASMCGLKPSKLEWLVTTWDPQNGFQAYYKEKTDGRNGS